MTNEQEKKRKKETVFMVTYLTGGILLENMLMQNVC